MTSPPVSGSLMIARFLPLALLILAPTVAAQMLPSGTWTGEVERGGDRQPVEVEIEQCATGFKVALTVDGRSAETETGAWRDRRLRFELPRLRMPGTLLPRALACTLQQRDDGSLDGTCTAGRATYRMRLVPPADAAFGCEE